MNMTVNCCTAFSLVNNLAVNSYGGTQSLECY